jgi:signal peptidase II
MTWGGGKARLLATVMGAVILLDQGAKLLVQEHLGLNQPVDVLGSVLRLTYIHNPGAAFGIYLGAWSRAIFLGLTVAALVGLAGLFGITPADDRPRLLAVALIGSGACGNLLDRLRSVHGVIDFVDVGLGSMRWPVFNVADVAVTTGAILLALSLWREDRRLEHGK